MKTIEFNQAQSLVMEEVGMQEGPTHHHVEFALSTATQALLHASDEFASTLFELRVLQYASEMGTLNGKPYRESVMDAVALFATT
jgi:hypothetical protein